MAAAAAPSHLPAMRYDQGVAAQKLGGTYRAAQLFEQLIQSGEKGLASRLHVNYFAKFGEKQTARTRIANAHYLVGLGYLGKSDRAKARTELAALDAT